MTSPVFALYLTCLFLGKAAQTTALKFSSSVRQDSSFISANVGDSVSLRCSYKGDVAAKLYWYKQTLGQKPRIISTLYDYKSNGTFHNEFNNNPRFTLDTENSKNYLKITDLHISDSATYYCVGCYLYKLEFSENIIVSVKGSGLNIQGSVHQSASESIQPGGSVTLNCIVHTATCDDGEHSVYWFKNSQESHPGIIYTHGGRNDQCERNSNIQTHNCVYNLTMKSLDLSHAGTYYCAVASCGRIVFGNGTKLDVGYSPVLVYFLSGALAFTTILSVLLAFSVYKMKRSSLQSAESQATFSASSTTNGKGYQEADNLHYAALSVNLPNRPRRARKNTKNECVYSSVKQWK
ncbi:immunoglobulin kappa light chain-like [Thunnus thynnus]|uniref:immunoglobulin kappa light chain-like n=1 Tax=Thunnus thynnus TaxID=8237 RepID=UPI00352925DD